MVNSRWTCQRAAVGRGGTSSRKFGFSG